MFLIEFVYNFPTNTNLKRYSRRIIWLEACTTNNNPRIVAYYYLRAVEQNQGIIIAYMIIVYIYTCLKNTRCTKACEG